MRNRHALMTAALLVALIFGLVACNPAETPNEGDQGDATSAPPEETPVDAGDDSPEPTDPPVVPDEPGETARSSRMTLLETEGLVEVRRYPDGEFAPIAAGATVGVGDQLRTGADGRVVLESDEGTVIVVTESSALLVATVGGTVQNPITRLFLNVGRVFNFGSGPLSDDAAYVVETPSGVAAIRGSALGVYHDPETGLTLATCLDGHCALTAEGETIELAAGEQAEIPSLGLAPGEMRVMDEEEVQLWIDLIAYLGEKGIPIQFEDGFADGAYGPYDPYTP